MIGATQKVDVYHLRRTREVRILVAVLDVKKIPKFADVCVKGCMYRLFFKPDEVVVPDQDQDKDGDLLTDDDKGNDANGDKHMGDAVPPPKPQGDRGLNLPAPSLLCPRANNLTGRLLCYKKHWI
jgi:hypothetical protein